MKYSITILFLGALVASFSTSAQQLPVFHQKLTDDFIMNPAYTGLSGGSISFSYRKLWSGIDDSPNVNYITGHTMLPNERLSFGGNLYMETISLKRNLRGSLTSAYLVNLTSDLQMSFGMAAEFLHSRLDTENIFAKDMDDPLLVNYSDPLYIDLILGVVFKYRIADLGLSYGRLVNRWFDNGSEIPPYLAVNANVYIPFRYGYDILEPRITYRNIADSKDQLDVSVFYTWEDLLLLGVTYRTESISALSIGFIWNKRYLLAYSMENNLGNTGQDLGMTHELTVRYSLNRQYFKRANPADYNPLPSSTFRKKK